MRDIILSEFGGTAHTYLAILEAIATGKTRRSEIARPAGLPATSLSKYLRELSDLFDLIEREVPITEQSWKTKKSRYKIRDPFITFWMRLMMLRIVGGGLKPPPTGCRAKSASRTRLDSRLRGNDTGQGGRKPQITIAA